MAAEGPKNFFQIMHPQMEIYKETENSLLQMNNSCEQHFPLAVKSNAAIFKNAFPALTGT